MPNANPTNTASNTEPMIAMPEWDKYKDKTPEQIVTSAYSHIEKASSKICAWYWGRIKWKRRMSWSIRILAFLLLAAGTSLPILATLPEAEKDELVLTQIGVACLIIAGLSQVCDKVFGFSGGWMRYTTTVMSMDNLTKAFQMEWADYMISNDSTFDIDDAKALFNLAKDLEKELLSLQTEETTKWIVEFSSGMTLLDNLIKSQREKTDKTLNSIRESIEKKKNEKQEKAESAKPGSLEVELKFKSDAEKVIIELDDKDEKEFLGYIYTFVQLSPGPHKIAVKTTSTPSVTTERIAQIKANSLAKIEIKVS